MFAGKSYLYFAKNPCFKGKIAIKNQGTHFWAIHLWQLWQKC